MLFDVLLKSVQFRFKITAYRLLKNLYGLRLVLAVYRVLVLYSPFYLFFFRFLTFHTNKQFALT